MQKEPIGGEEAIDNSVDYLQNDTLLLDGSDPIDAALIRFSTDVRLDKAPSANQQREFVRAIQQDRPDARMDLVEGNLGLVAAIVYGLKSGSIEQSEYLLSLGSNLLIQAATNYDTGRQPVSFVNFAIPFIKNGLAEIFPQLDNTTTTDEAPMYALYRFAYRIKDTNRRIKSGNRAVKVSETVDIAARTDVVLEPFTLKQQRVLPYIYMDTEDIAATTGLSHPTVNINLFRAAKRIGAKNRYSLALYLQQQGLELNINHPPKPLGELFTVEQMELMQKLHLYDEELAQYFNLSKHKIEGSIHDLKIRAKARNRTELLLMAYKFDNGDRLDSDPTSRQEQLAAKLGLATLDLIELNGLMTDLDPESRVLIREFYLNNGNPNVEDMPNPLGLSSAEITAAIETGVERLKKLATGALQSTNRNS